MTALQKAILVPIIAISAYFLASFTEPSFHYPLTIFIAAVLLWFSESLPLPITAMLIPASAVLLGVQTTEQAFAPFGNEILFLFIGTFILTAALQKHGIDQRIAIKILSLKFINSVSRLVLAVGIICFFLSMWISNTATCALMVPICIGLGKSLAPHFVSKRDSEQLIIHLLLCCTYSSSIGGMSTPVGSPPNVLAFEFLDQQGIHFSFLQWTLIGLPTAIILCVLSMLLLRFLFPLPKTEFNQVSNLFAESNAKLEALKTPEIQAIFAFLLAICLWIIPDLLIWIFPQNVVIQKIPALLPMGVVAILSAGLLFCLSIKDSQGWRANMQWSDAKNIDWGSIILFGGGLCLGNLLSQSGLAQYAGTALFINPEFSSIALLASIVLSSILLSEFSSNTAAAAILMPIVIGIFNTINADPQFGIIAVALGASCGFMLPVSTPPNAIVYGTGLIKLKDLVKTGILFDLLALFVITLGIYILI